jgi:coiled-coil domain-containing protein 39
MADATTYENKINNSDNAETGKSDDTKYDEVQSLSMDMDSDHDNYLKVSKVDGFHEESGSLLNGDKREYKSKWTSSHVEIDENDRTLENDYLFSEDDELPIFADEECKRLHKLTKQLERERDAAAKKVKENKERISIMQDHLHNVRQEIDHTNALVAAKNKEIATEKHLIALGERDLAVIISDIKTTDATIVDEKERLRSIQNEIHIATDEREKLKLDLNWNQEELEQWATAAAKKESDTLALQKYTRSDEVLIKELTLKLENMTKKSLEKNAQLENEITETKTKQLEVDRLAKTFRAQHEERRVLVQQWQETVNAMKDRDRDIDELSRKYADVQQVIENQIATLLGKRETLDLLKVSYFFELQHIRIPNGNYIMSYRDLTFWSH